MFHPNKIAKKQEISWIELNRQDPKMFPQGSRLMYHSVDACQQAMNHLDEINGKRVFNLDEERWIRNERAICRTDFLYWATRYAWIKDWTETLIKFNPNIAQRIIIDVMAKMEAEDIAILLQIHKARQEGVTTLAQLIMLWRTEMTNEANTLLASSRPASTAQMISKMDLAYKLQPFWMRPEIGTNNAEKIGFDGQNSFFHLRHGAMMSDMGRGDTFTSFHLSEVSGFLNPGEAIDGALLRAVHDSPWLLGLFESTGAGRHGWWYDKWKYNTQYWPLREARICPVFLPWYLLRELYPTLSWIKAHPIRANWVPEDRTIAHAKKAEEYVRSGENPIVTNELGSGWSMPREQMWFWELERRSHEADHKLHLFYQELCATPEDGFQSPNAGIFDAELIHTLRDETKMPYGVYGIRCNQGELDTKFQVHDPDIDRNQKPFEVKAKWSPTQEAHYYTLYPLLHRGSAPFDPYGKIIMWEPPRSNKLYGEGVDTGYGLGKDRSVCEILRKGDAEELDAQVCEFASPQMNSMQLWPIALALGTLYSTSVHGDIKQAKVVIEGAANGENVYNELKKRGWRNFHNWVRYNKKRVLEANANLQLWYTNAWSRPLMLDMFFDAVNNGWIDLNSGWLLDELGALELHEEKMKIAAALGEHDDRIMALGMVLFSMHALETKHNDFWKARVTREKDAPEQYAKFRPDAQDRGPKIEDDSLQSYTYRIVRPGDFKYEDLQGPGAGLWQPGKE